MPSLKSLWASLKGMFTKKPDPTPDPEDTKAYEHFDKIFIKYGALERPVQVLKDRKKPSDVSKSADDLGLDNPPVNYVWWIDVYDGPRGSGYMVNYEVKRGLKTFRKVVNIGPEEEREQDWKEVVENVLP